jgi:Asp-tRNA(Asn)/Glu-tRNA(Gln) amidotransferase A subunit family amidase
LHIAAESAVDSAKRAEALIMKETEVGLLDGVPVAIKDCTLPTGIRTTFGSKPYEDLGNGASKGICTATGWRYGR